MTDMQVISADKDASFDTVNIVVSEFVTTLEERVITTSFEVCVLPIKDLPEIFVPSENKNVTTHENEAVAIVGTTLLGVDDFAIERATEYRLDVIATFGDVYLSTSESFDVTKLKSLSYGLSNNASYGMTLVADMTTLNEAIASIVYLPRNDYIGKAFVQITLMENTQIVNSASSAFWPQRQSRTRIQ